MTKKPSEPTVGRYLAETGYAFGKPPLKMPVEPPRVLPIKDPTGSTRPSKACPPRLLIGYEHARCNTNTDVILPFEPFDRPPAADATDAWGNALAFEPAVTKLAEKHAPTCPVCGTPMRFAVWGPHEDEVETRHRVGSDDDNDDDDDDAE